MRLVLVDRLIRGARDRLMPEVELTPQPKPERVFWWWEQICNLSCNHCDIGHRTQSYRIDPALDLAQKQEVIRRLSSWLGGPFSLSFIAGEPFLHKDIFEVLACASAHQANTSLTTNGTLLATPKRAEQVIASGLGFMAVSVDSQDAAFHDRTRGKPGTWMQATKTLELVKAARERAGAKNPQIYVNSIIMRDNLDGLLALTDWVREQGFDGHTFQPVATTDFFQGKKPQGPRWYEQSPLWPDRDEALAFVDEIERRRDAGYPIRNSDNDFRHFRAYFRDPVAFGRAENCESELKTMLVTHDGHVKMCPNTDEPFGHILKDELDEMWGSPAAVRARRHVYECESQCKILANTKEDFYF